MRGEDGSPGRTGRSSISDLIEVEEKGPSLVYLEDSRIVMDEGNRFIIKTRRLREKYEVDTAKARREMIANLLALGEEASKRGLSVYQAKDDRQSWSRIASTIYRTADAVMKSYDEGVIAERLSELEAFVQELAEKNREAKKSG